MDPTIYWLIRVARFFFPVFQVLANIVAVVFVISGIGDFLVDAYFWGRELARYWLFRINGWQKLTLERLMSKE